MGVFLFQGAGGLIVSLELIERALVEWGREGRGRVFEEVVPVLAGGAQAFYARKTEEHVLGDGVAGGIGIEAAVNLQVVAEE